MMAVRTAFQLFCDCWHLYRKYILRTANEETLEQFKKETEEIYTRYKQEPMAKEMLLAVIGEVERKEERNT
ncbi:MULTISPECIES: hypothetical protein [Sellimonas]|nr:MULTISPECIES: hypothetical protein [Sellimonas]